MATAGKPTKRKFEQGSGPMNDSRNAQEIRDILRGQFDAVAEHARDPATSALFSKLAETTSDIPGALADAYSEFFDDMQDSERELAMMDRIGVSWWPENATKFLEAFISVSSGGEKP
jgi:hypothetical protein